MELKAVAAAAIGGLIVAAFNSWRTYVQSQRTARLNYLDRQLSSVYGPLHFYCRIAEAYFRHEANIDRVSSELFSGPDAPRLNSPTLSEEIDQAIVIRNEFTERVRQNNNAIVETLTKHWDLVDPADMPAFEQQVLNVTRHELEFPGGNWRLPFDVRRLLPPAFFIDPQFLVAVNRRFAEKSSEAALLHGDAFSCRRWIGREVANLERPGGSESPGPG